MLKTTEILKKRLETIKEKIEVIRNSNMNSGKIMELMDLKLQETKILKTLNEPKKEVA